MPPPSLASAWTFDECDGEGGIITMARSDSAMRVVNTTEAYHKPLPLAFVIAPPDAGQQKRSMTTMSTEGRNNLNQVDDREEGK